MPVHHVRSEQRHGVLWGGRELQIRHGVSEKASGSSGSKTTLVRQEGGLVKPWAMGVLSSGGKGRPGHSPESRRGGERRGARSRQDVVGGDTGGGVPEAAEGPTGLTLIIQAPPGRQRWTWRTEARRERLGRGWRLVQNLLDGEPVSGLWLR